VEGEVIKVPGVVNLAATIAAAATPMWMMRRIARALFRKAMQASILL